MKTNITLRGIFSYKDIKNLLKICSKMIAQSNNYTRQVFLLKKRKKTNLFVRVFFRGDNLKDKIPGIPGSSGIDGGLGKVSYLSQELFVSSQEGTFPLHLTAKINLIQSPIIISINDEFLV